MALPYQQPGLRLARGTANDTRLVRALQRDLRALGYLHHGIDGQFGGETELAVRRLQYDLTTRPGPRQDGPAPVDISDFNGPWENQRRAVGAIDGVVDQGLAVCIARLLADDQVVQLPRAEDAAGENAKALRAIRSIRGADAPAPFMAAMFIQESGGQHFRVPTSSDEDNFIVVGLDADDRRPERITSRRYGIGQYTIYHHPPRASEVTDFMLDPVRNVEMAFAEFREKFDGFVAGPTDVADDRTVEHGDLDLRLCKYPQGDARYMTDCRACARDVAKVQIRQGMPHYPGATSRYEPEGPDQTATYDNVPDRAAFDCDWPYAARRYNGGGPLSYHYQARILRNLLGGPVA